MILKKQTIRRSFNSAIQTYDIASDWQKNVGNLLLEYISNFHPQHKIILDLGAGTGYLARCIQQYYSHNQILLLDIAESMLLFSKQHLGSNGLICADAENLALKNACIDMIVSNMALHWCYSLEKALQEQYRVLMHDGLLIFSILGPQSLQPLKTAWEQVDHHSHINSFPEATRVKQACYSAGFSLLNFERHEIKKHYENVHELMHHLKATGAKNVSDNQPRGLMGKQKIKQLSEQYKNPMHYEVFTVICQKPKNG